MNEKKYQEDDEHGNSCQINGSDSSLRFPFAAPEPYLTQKISDDIYWLRIPLPFKLDHINVYLIAEQDGWCLIDTGMGTNYSKRYWQQLFDSALQGKPITRIVITHNHPDHVGLANWLQQKFHCPVIMSKREFEIMAYLFSISGSTPPDYYLDYLLRAGMSTEHADKVRQHRDNGYDKAVDGLPKDCQFVDHGDNITLGKYQFNIIIGSGHSPAHVSLYCPELNILFSGDQVLPDIPSMVTLYPKNPKFKDHRKQNPLGRWLKALNGLKALPSDTLVLPSHNKPFIGLHARVDEIIANHCALLNQLLAALQQGKTVSQSIMPIYKRKVRDQVYVMFISELLAHIQFLEQLGLVAREQGAEVDIFSTISAPDMCQQIDDYLSR
ncbi:MBL fold metallo-hydrolase [Thalassotalea sp. HSM 43]|uniref:MBL fold metallo-hydrolase n=1 Tax=Thalassotalea sp. HSM 43 TaxID=2552945 RepID=UPI00108199D4|nr:MBL fold metallo-hydrolase [Thalassotalea sp. HSM 43]QBY03304.1 MBL fold metallo-hydrolase [Thalassotalea sp. HSM 43]